MKVSFRLNVLFLAITECRLAVQTIRHALSFSGGPMGRQTPMVQSCLKQSKFHASESRAYFRMWLNSCQMVF